MEIAEWNSFTSEEKETKIHQIILELEPAFTYRRLEIFEQNGVRLETAILELEGEEFVLIPGQKNVTLGWDVDSCELGPKVKKAFYEYWEEGIQYYKQICEEIKEDYEEQIADAKQNGESEEKIKMLMDDYKDEITTTKEKAEQSFEAFMDELNQMLRTSTSSIRTADIGMMLVERKLHYIEKNMKYEEFIHEIKRSSFTIPTEDEWEYLCGAGTRTFFHWGDSLEEELNAMFEIGSVNRKNYESQLDKQNMFGLFIATNSYQYELVEDCCITKGGDGGCSLCGGDGAIYVAPIFSTFYRNPKKHSELSKNFYYYRRIIRLY